MMRLLLVAAEVLIVSPRPLGPSDRVSGKFVECLPQKLGAGKTEMDPFGFAAGLLHGRDPAVALHLVSSLVAIALRSEGYDQARDQRGASSRQRCKQPAVGVGQHELGDALVESRDLVA